MKKRGNHSQKQESMRRGKTMVVALVVLAVCIVAAAVFVMRSGVQKGERSKVAGQQTYARKETRATLAPGLFVGRAAQAYQAAKDIPDVLDQMYCYCQCDKHFGHKSLLSCFTDGHAAT